MKRVLLYVAGLFKSKQEMKDMDRYIINHFNAGFQSKFGTPVADDQGVYRVSVNSPQQVREVSNELNAAGFRVTRSEEVTDD